jgi:DNA-binding LacI/PurR family transcriptional regulator
MPASLKDVAAQAGVSVKTASNVVNNYEFVSQSTRERVQAAIDELDYRPNLSARRLRTGRSNLIALSVPEIDAPYFAELASEIVDAAERRGWTVLIDKTGGERTHEQIAAAGIRAHLVDGAIASPLSMTAEDVAALSGSHPLVLLGERLPHVGGADHVAIDNVAAAAEATHHLISLGRTSIATIGASTESTGALRLKGFRKAIAATKRKHDPRLVMPVQEYHRQDGFDAMTRLLALDRRPDAVFCFNDLLALGAIRAVHLAGLKVPSDVAVVGFDDIEDGRFSTPTLTTISPDKAGIARAAVSVLARRIDADAAIEAREVFATHRLIVRESCGG